MNTKRIMMRWVIVLLLLATLPVLTVVMAQEQEPAEQSPGSLTTGELTGNIPWLITETEPNNNQQKADDWCVVVNLGGLDERCSGVNGGFIENADDVDFWRLYVPNRSEDYPDRVELDHYPVLIDIEAQSLGSPLDSYICLYSDDGLELACNDNTDTLDSMLYYNFEVSVSDPYPARMYYLAVRAKNGTSAGVNGKYQLLISTPYLFSAAAANLGTGAVDGITFQSGDILAYSRFHFQGNDYRKWVMLLDLSDLAVKGNLTNLSGGWRNSDFLLVGFANNVRLPGISRPVTPWEVVVFNPTTVGPRTEGTFELWWDGRDKGLTTTSEKIDAIDWPNWLKWPVETPRTRLSVSTTGKANVTLWGDEPLKLFDEDIGTWTSGRFQNNLLNWNHTFDTSTATELEGVKDVVAYSYMFVWKYPPINYPDYDGNFFMVFQDTARCLGLGVLSQKDVAVVAESAVYVGEESWADLWNCVEIWHGPDHGWNYNIDAIQMQIAYGGMQ